MALANDSEHHGWRKEAILVDKLWVLDGDVLDNRSDPLAFSWPAKAFSKTDLVMVPKLEAWLINDALDPDKPQLFVGEDITDEDLDSAYCSMSLDSKHT